MQIAARAKDTTEVRWGTKKDASAGRAKESAAVFGANHLKERGSTNRRVARRNGSTSDLRLC